MISHCNRVLLFAALALSVGFSQPNRRSPAISMSLSPVSFEAIPFFSNDTGRAIVHIHYRIKQDFFIVLKNQGETGPPYLGKGELTVELRDEDGNSTAREFRPILLPRSSNGRGDQRVPDIQGVISLSVPSGTYSVSFNLDDSQSERSFVDNRQKVTTRRPLTSRLDISAPLFVQPAFLFNNPRMFEALNHGTDVFFGERGGYLFNAFLPTDSVLTVTYHLTNKTEFKVLPPQEFTGDSLLVLDGISGPEPPSDDPGLPTTFPIRYGISDAPRGWKVVYLSLPLEKLYPGEAALTIDFSSGSSQKRLEFTFRTFWPLRPRSLANLEFAVEALRHIATEEEMDRFQTLSNSRFVQAFFDFWRKRDPDTSTAYNEMMAEYYRRVDIAIQRYSANTETDGWKSDQGRIFILYGSPDKTERLFSPSQPPREVWTYQKLKKRFVFEDQRRTGSYILISVEDL